MHLPLLALLWVVVFVVAVVGLAVLVVLALLVLNKLSDSWDQHKERRHRQDVRDDWNAKKLAVDYRFANATENADKAAARADAQYVAMKSATVRLEVATKALNTARV